MVQGKVAHTTADHLLQCGDTRTRRAHGTCWLAVVNPVIGDTKDFSKESGHARQLYPTSSDYLLQAPCLNNSSGRLSELGVSSQARVRDRGLY